MNALGPTPAHLPDVLTLAEGAAPGADDAVDRALDGLGDETLEILSPVLDLNERAFEALLASGLTSVVDVEALDDADLLRLGGMNESTLSHLRTRIAEYRRSQDLARMHFERAGHRLCAVNA